MTNCYKCRFYSNDKSNDFGRTRVIRCIYQDVIADDCSENGGDEARAQELFYKNCPLLSDRLQKTR